MSSEQKSFTGRKRDRKTKKSVHIKNAVAKNVITLGGIGTIISVLLVCFFLVYVVIPLFLPPSLPFNEEFSFSDLYNGAKPVHMQVDDYLEIGFVILNDGNLVYFDMVDGSILGKKELIQKPVEENPADDSAMAATAATVPQDKNQDSSLAESSPSITAFASAVNEDDIIFGFSDGTVRLGKIDFEIDYLRADEVPQEIKELEVDAPVPFKEGMIRRTPQDQYRYQVLTANLAEPLKVSDSGSAILKLDFSNTPAGESFVAYTVDRKLIYSKISRQTNMLTGEESISSSNSKIDITARADGFTPDWIKLSGLGEFVYMIWKDGILRRYNTRDLSQMALMEEISTVDEVGEQISSVDFLIGKRSLVLGTTKGDVDIWFTTRPKDAVTEDSFNLTRAHHISGAIIPVTSLAYSERSRKFAAGFADGTVRLYYSTNNSLLATGQLAESNDPILQIVISPKEDHLISLSDNLLSLWQINAPHPETTLGAMFLPVWYEGADAPEHSWQTSSAGSDFEPKYGMMPLIFGTLKATFYSMLFGVPIALLAAIYTSEFLHPKYKTAFKPTIEMMASLPSVVLGFMAGLVLAPFIENIVPEVLTSIFTVPIAMLIGAYLFQLIPPGKAVLAARYRLWGVIFTIPLGIWLAMVLGGPIENLLFSGNIKTWLANDEVGSGLGGWMLLMVPLSLFIIVLINGWFAPKLRSLTKGWSSTKYARFDLLKFFMTLVLTIVVALILSWILTQFGLDPRGSYIDTYVQRNALIVGFIMGFAIIPIIYTIAEDALSAVPSHLRAGSLGAGATPWQTAVRIIIPTAMSGLFSAIMIGLGRAVGETMIVLMAAGSTPVMEMNIFNGFRTLSANIAIELPEAVRNSTHYRSLFLAALVLFILTFIINTLAEVVRQRFRKRSSQL